MNNDAYDAQAELKGRAVHSDPVVVFTKKQFEGLSREQAKAKMRDKLRTAMATGNQLEPTANPSSSALALG